MKSNKSVFRCGIDDVWISWSGRSGVSCYHYSMLQTASFIVSIAPLHKPSLWLWRRELWSGSGRRGCHWLDPVFPRWNPVRFRTFVGELRRENERRHTLLTSEKHHLREGDGRPDQVGVEPIRYSCCVHVTIYCHGVKPPFCLFTSMQLRSWGGEGFICDLYQLQWARERKSMRVQEHVPCLPRLKTSFECNIRTALTSAWVVGSSDISVTFLCRWSKDNWYCTSYKYDAHSQQHAKNTWL